MKTVARTGALRSWRRAAPSPVVFVPTMGALHEGHASLIRKARKLAGSKGSVVVSVFVNPTQFGPREDLSKYPRPFTSDRALCEREGVDLLFHPTPAEMYAEDASVMVRESSLATVLCGASRPGHFDGVCTVVTMLFNMVRPDSAVFGEKDWQQLAVIRRLVRDLAIPVKIIGHPTVREEDGLALSSRNRLLTPAVRKVAPRIYQAMTAAAMEAEDGQHSVSRLLRGLSRDLEAIPGAKPDYAQIMDEEVLRPLDRVASDSKGSKARIFVAVRFGSVRLIDNLAIAASR